MITIEATKDEQQSEKPEMTFCVWRWASTQRQNIGKAATFEEATSLLPDGGTAGKWHFEQWGGFTLTLEYADGGQVFISH